MKVSTLPVLLLLVVSGWHTIATGQEKKGSTKSEENNSESTVESKAAAERAFDAVVEEGQSERNLSLAFSVKGTGETTGLIATISVTNNGPNAVDLIDTGTEGMNALALLNRETEAVSSVFGTKGKYEDGLIDLNCSMAYIPSGKKYQDYVATGANWPPGITQAAGEPDQFSQTPIVTVNPGESIVIPVDGYCANIREPPVPLGSTMTDVSSWISPGEAQFPEPGQLDELGIIVREAPPGEGPYIANIPLETGLSKDQTLIMSINPQLTPYIETWEFNSALAAFLFDALDRIRITAEVLQSEDVIRTPFSSPASQEHELETLIQQTFWLYASVLRGENYTKEEFSDQMTEQFETNTGNKIKNVPPETAEKLDSGVDDFWGSFELVGAAAKVLKSEKDSELEGGLPPGTQEKLENEFESSDLSGVKTQTAGTSSEAADNAGAPGYTEGDEIAYPEGVSKEEVAEEVVHAANPQTVASNADLESVENKKDFDNWRRKKYDDYVLEREINGKSHKMACKVVGVDVKSELAKALKRVYQNEKK